MRSFITVKDKSGPPSEQFKPDDTVKTHGTTATVVNEESESVKGQNTWIYIYIYVNSLYQEYDVYSTTY